MRRLICVAAIAALGCDYTFDGKAPVIPVIGSPPETGRLPRLNVNRATSGASLMRGADGAPWAYFEEALEGGAAGAPLNGRRLVRLEPPETTELIASNDVVAGKSAVYVFDRGTEMMPSAITSLVVRSAGEAPPGREFTLPKGPGLLVLGKLDQVFAYLPLVEGTTQFLIQRRDGSFSRMVTLPSAVDPKEPPGGFLALSPDERSLLQWDPDDRLLLHDTTAERTVDIGIRPGAASFDLTGRTLLTCGAAGLRTVPVDGTLERVLDPEACDPGGGLMIDMTGVYYGAANGVRRAPVDGGRAPELIAPGGLRALAVGGAAIAYSREPNDFYAHAAGDGFVGDWQFMRRGVAVSFSASGRLHWLEDAAKSNPIGDLHASPIGGAPSKLALNVFDYDILTDGRVIAADQQPFRGEFNRIIIIDEAAGHARYVANQATGYTIIPGSTDVLVDVYTGPDTFNIVRVPLPPR